jgi:putative ABC transport system substrate-binding protein
MQRRSFIFLLGGAAGSRSFVARAQQNERPRRVGVLLPAVTNDPQWQPRVEAFRKAFARLGWTIGGNVQIDTRWDTANSAELRKQAGELAALAPDVILAGGTSAVGPLPQVTRTVPIERGDGGR